MSDDPLITMTDLNRLYCVPGIRRRLVAAGVDFRAFVRHGLPLSSLKGIGLDVLVERAAEAKAAAEGRL